MNFPTMRDKRNIFGPTHFSIANYCTETKNDMKTKFGEDYILDNLHLIPDQMKRNLADTIIVEDEMSPKNEFSNKFDAKTNETNDNSRLTGITNFFSGVLNIITGAMFSKRKQTDISCESDGEMALPWHTANSADQNKISHDEKYPNDLPSALLDAEMGDCNAAVANCQNKLDQVKLLLSNPIPCTVRIRRHPKKAFVEASSVEEGFEDAFAPEDFENLCSNSYLEYCTPYCYHDDNIHEITAPKIKTEICKNLESTNIVQNVQPVSVNNNEKDALEAVSNNKHDDLVSSCEDKLSKLKMFLEQRKKNKVIESEPKVEIKTSHIKTENKIKDKRFKNQYPSQDKRNQNKMRQSIQEDVLSANEITTDELSSVENSPSSRNLDNLLPNPNVDYFDEISGRFHPTSVDSEDSFQIVFKDNPKIRRASDCESEDSFIVFDNSPDSCYVSTDCYTSNDVFGSSSDSESCDSESELSDSGCGNLTYKLSHSLSKSVSNLTDDSLYINASEDEVDCTKVDLTVCDKVTQNENTGLIIDWRKKRIRKSLPPKKVQFSEEPPKIHVMRVWAFAARQARAGHWERYALDRERFKRRIADVEVAVSWVLRPQHRSRVMFQRFMPWWNAQKRKELAEKKQKEEEEKLKTEVETQNKNQDMVKTDAQEEFKIDIAHEAISRERCEKNEEVFSKGIDIQNEYVNTVSTETKKEKVKFGPHQKIKETCNNQPVTEDLRMINMAFPPVTNTDPKVKHEVFDTSPLNKESFQSDMYLCPETELENVTNVNSLMDATSSEVMSLDKIGCMKPNACSLINNLQNDPKNYGIGKVDDILVIHDSNEYPYSNVLTGVENGISRNNAKSDIQEGARDVFDNDSHKVDEFKPSNGEIEKYDVTIIQDSKLRSVLNFNKTTEQKMEEIDNRQHDTESIEHLNSKLEEKQLLGLIHKLVPDNSEERNKIKVLSQIHEENCKQELKGDSHVTKKIDLSENANNFIKKRSKELRNHDYDSNRHLNLDDNDPCKNSSKYTLEQELNINEFTSQAHETNVNTNLRSENKFNSL